MSKEGYAPILISRNEEDLTKKSKEINCEYEICDILEKDQIVAGCQYHRVHWVINDMKGLSGKIIMNVVPRIPILNKLFNPKCFEFLAFEGIYFKPGYEHKLHSLFEGLLAREKLKSAMFWMGKSCPIRKQIMINGNLGMIHSFIKDSDVEVMASFKNMTEIEISDGF